MFAVDYFGRPAFLAQSPQLYKQIMVGVFERVFEVGPVFRAEPHDTPRHLNEYVSLDVELRVHRGPHDGDGGARRGCSPAWSTAGREQAAEALALLGCALPDVPDAMPRIHFADAQALIERATGEDRPWRARPGARARALAGRLGAREHGSDFLFVVGYPMVKRPFYTHPDPERPEYSRSFDLLFRGLELVTGGQRLHRHADYLAALAERGLDPAPFAGYLRGVPARHAAARRLRDRPGALGGAAGRRPTCAKALFPRDLQRLTP